MKITLRIKSGVPVAADFAGSEVPLVEDLLTGKLYTIDFAGVVHEAGGGERIDGGASRTLQRSDEGRLISCTGTVTVPPNSSVPFQLGVDIRVHNNSAAATTIAQGAGVTIRLDGTATTGDRTLAQRGVATLTKVGTNEWIVRGAAVT